jgi:hypothetical protein
MRGRQDLFRFSREVKKSSDTLNLPMWRCEEKWPAASLERAEPAGE